ncbi:hypothetical protein RQP46_001657 [Phenoliferia psychrophenolica]
MEEEPQKGSARSEGVLAVLNVVPNVERAYLDQLLTRFADDRAAVLNELFDKPYPKSTSSVTPGKGKKRARSVERDDEDERDWMNTSERGQTTAKYRDEALEQLCVDFRMIPKAAVRSALAASSHCYAPASVLLAKQSKQSETERGWATLKCGRVAGKGKGKGKETVVGSDLAKEKVWLARRTVELEREKEEDEEAAAQGLLVECNCCFGEFRFEVLLQCSEGCVFCKECAQQLASTQIAQQRHTLPCMSSDCPAFFPETEAARFLPRSQLAALQKLRQQAEIDEAGLAGLEKCPWCPFAMCIDDPYEVQKLFVCEREGCERTSCRKCKKDEHLPKSCEEMIKDNDIHAVEDAMSAALLRRCPKCTVPYLKSDGCNYITCAQCHTGSCYVCQLVCAKSPVHFDMTYHPGVPASSTAGSKCPLFDFDNSRAVDLKKVEAARTQAAAEVRAYNPDITQADIDRLK